MMPRSQRIFKQQWFPYIVSNLMTAKYYSHNCGKIYIAL